MQIWITPLASLLGFALLFILERVVDRAAGARHVETLAELKALSVKLKALEQELDTARVSMRNGQEAMVVLSEQLGMEFGELRALLTPKPAAPRTK